MGSFYMEATQINYRRDETFKTVDQKLQELSETSAIDTDIAPVFKSTNTYAPGDLVYYRNKLYRFNVEHTGAWAAGDVTATDVTTEVSSLRSGLTNVQGDVKLNTQDLTTTSRTKNIAPMTLDNLKYYNSAGTWTDNVYVYEGITYTVNTDNDGNISSIGVNGTASGTYSHLSVWLNIKAGSYKMNGAPTGNDYYLQLYRSGILDIKCKGSDTDVVLASDVTSVAFRIIVMGGVTADNLTYYPMLRLATESATYTPYIPSVNSRLETVESGAFKSIKKIKSDGVKTYSNIFSELFSDITGSAKYYILYNNTIFTMSAKTSQSATFSRIIYSSNTIYVSALLIRSNSSATFTEAEITANGVTYNDYSTDVMPANSNVELVM